MDHPEAERSPAAHRDAPPIVVESIRDAVLDELGDLEALQRRASMVWEEYRDQLVAHPDAISLPASAIRDGDVRVACSADRVLGFSVTVPSADGIPPRSTMTTPRRTCS